ncbi:MAG: YdeI/OmpD-associated family protein, partial [Gemmatimonadaceae bacterium]
RRNARARTTFEAFSPSNRRDYVEWIIEAKREATRASRLATTIEWLEEGKPRNWKYQ